MSQYRLEPLENGRHAALYIDKSLQFDSRDEYIYHETLFIPPAVFALGRSPEQARGLVLGGGDGLGLRELLKFPQVSAVDLVDYDPDIVKLAQGELSPYNAGSLHDKRVTVHVREASSFLRSTTNTYDFIVADFTFPQTLEGCSLFTQDFFAEIAGRIRGNGFFALNACSPYATAEAFWSVYRTLAKSGFYPKPLQLKLPSFIQHGYGDWGFFLASPSPLMCGELNTAGLPEDCRYLSREVLRSAMIFSAPSVARGFQFSRVVREPSDLQALLHAAGIFSVWEGDGVDFSGDILPLELWLHFIDSPGYVFFSMSAYWKERVVDILSGLDWETLVREIESGLRELPEKAAAEIRKILDGIPRNWQDLDFRSQRAQRFLVALVSAIILMNMLCADNAYAKGYYGRSSHRSSHTASSAPYQPLAYAAPIPFVSENWLKPGVVPTMSGAAAAALALPADVSGASGEAKVPAFFALDDNTFLTAKGDVFQKVPETKYILRLGADYFTVIHPGDNQPVIELAADAATLARLRGAVETHRKALSASIKKFEGWLSWAALSGNIIPGSDREVKELNKLKELDRILDRLSKRRQPVFLTDNTGGPGLDIAPSIRVTEQGTLFLNGSDGVWRSYAFKGFVSSPGSESVSSDEKLDKFIGDVLAVSVKRLGPMHPMHDVIMSRL